VGRRTVLIRPPFVRPLPGIHFVGWPQRTPGIEDAFDPAETGYLEIRPL